MERETMISPAADPRRPLGVGDLVVELGTATHEPGIVFADLRPD